MRAVKGIVFDKDGTLVDFRGTWDTFAARLVVEMTGGDQAAAKRLGAAMQFDIESGQFLAGSPIIAGTNREMAECIQSGLEEPWPIEKLERFLAERAHSAAMAPVVPLDAFCARLKAADLKIGVATNDSEGVARGHLEQMNVAQAFDFIAGYDSGHGGKPGPGMLLAFCAATGLTPEECIMVGDSPHDLIAAERAGMRSVGVLTGIYEEHELTPHTDIVLPDIGHLPNWLSI